MPLHNLRLRHVYTENDIGRMADDIPYNVFLAAGVLEEEHYQREWSPQTMQLAGTAALGFIGNAGIQWPCAILADGSAGDVHGSLMRPRDWRFGTIKFSVWYTSTVAGAALFNLDIRMWGVAEGGSLLPVAIAIVTPQLAGPAVAQTQLVYSSTMTLSGVPAQISAKYGRLSWRLERDGATDANNNPMNVMAVVLNYQPGKHEV